MSNINKEELMRGLSDSQVNKSKQDFGTNALAKKETESLWSMFIGAFDDIWIKVLCAALVMKIVISVIGVFVPALAGENDVVEIISIVLAIALATGFSTLSEYRNSSRSEALQEEYNKTYAKVVRNGKLVNILTSEIVKGDTILVQAGDKVPTDGVLFEGHIKVSQAALNGESRDENKTAADNLDEAESTDYASANKVFMGSVVTSGEGYMVATVIGDASELGKINKALTDDNEEDERKDTSSLKLEVVAAGIGKLGVSAAAIAGVLDVVLNLIRTDEPITVVFVLLLVAEAVMLMASIVIMAVPEGLPMMNSLVQSMNTESMYKKNILVSHKAAFSDSAYMNVLFSDKTGTITQGNLSLVEFITGDGKIVDHIPNQEFIEAITLNNLAKISEGKPIGSNNMDRALLGYALEHGYDDSKNDPDKVADISGFDSEKKCATVTLKNGLVYWKGATENIIGKVTHYMLPSGEEKEFTSADKKAVEDQMLAQAKRTMKLLSVAKIADGKTVLMAVLCLRDNVRTDAVETVEILNNAGIQVVMVTGDAEETAVAIAKEAGILKDEKNDVVLTHEELEQMSDEELKKKLPNLRVVSRAKPLDKKRLVSISQQLDNVCGMTGDGVNDAPALKQADIGFAMGDGTAVAQEAGDVVILNNSLTSIKDCVLNSRTMSKSVGKFLIFQLTVNISTLLMNIIAPILGWTEPFSIVQILWINLIMDTLAAMAFGGEPILDRYMNEKPALRKDNILTTYIKSAIGTSSVFITLGSILILENIGGITDFVTPAGCADPELYEKTFMFAFFIYSIIFNSLNTRSEKFNVFEHIRENKNFIIVMGAIFVLQTVIIEIGGQVFSTTTLNAKALFVSVLLAVLIIPVDMVRKAIVSKK
ncbi:cation-transporting P-type ATPase [Roseburia sp. AM23-20]|uniref:cation-translocating P-type ATPase n=1 Tax=Roseburia sp. AM23-20 TaxID=2292066 RepID=UPI000E4A1E6B|nr:cation-transporting P-type ATPase [Roseburia sp. AM23-20]RHF91182.1 cation-transporting P-type ATPase [Roseburia sp. AM23-20]RHF93244.1 cation-transporting P-type ATPase [Roseburia sp. AM23-20]